MSETVLRQMVEFQSASELSEEKTGFVGALDELESDRNFAGLRDTE